MWLQWRWLGHGRVSPQPGGYVRFGGHEAFLWSPVPVRSHQSGEQSGCAWHTHAVCQRLCRHAAGAGFPRWVGEQREIQNTLKLLLNFRKWNSYWISENETLIEFQKMKLLLNFRKWNSYWISENETLIEFQKKKTLEHLKKCLTVLIHWNRTKV